MHRLSWLIASAFLMVSQGTGSAATWDDTILQVEEKAQLYWDFGALRGGMMWVGTGINELDIDRHECTISGRMLGKNSAIAELERQDAPPMVSSPNDEQLREIMHFSVSLSNWAYTARRLQELQTEDIQQIWNLNCVGRFGINENEYIISKTPSASFRQDGSSLVVLGDIYFGMSFDFAEWLSHHPETTQVILGSGGGSVVDAIEMGLLIRKMNLRTALGQNCYSACPLVFIGGSIREIWSPYPVLGFHKISKPDGSEVIVQDPIYRTVFDYVNSMGVNGEFVLVSMFSAEPNEMFEPNHESLCANNVATWIQRNCSR